MNARKTYEPGELRQPVVSARFKKYRPWRLLIFLISEFWRLSPPHEVPAAPESEVFPGSVPADAELVSQEHKIPLYKEQWVTIGPYAKAGPYFKHHSQWGHGYLFLREYFVQSSALCTLRNKHPQANG